MKKLFLLIVFFICTLSVQAQTVTVGAQSTVMTFAQRNAIAQFWPDGGVNAVLHSGTNYVYSPGGGAAGMFGEKIPDLTNWNSGVTHVATTTNIPLGASTDFDSTFAGGGSLYFDAPSGILIGLYHGEHNFGGGVFYSGHGLAYSTDFGVNWHKLGPVVLPQASFSTTCGVEVGNSTLVSDGTFLYDYYSDMPQSGCPSSFASSITVARASIASVVAAAQAGTPFTSGPGNLFMKFTGSGTWTGLGVTDWGNQSGGGGAFTAFFGANDNLREPVVRFNSFLGKYVLTYVISDQSAILMRFSSDGLTWGSPTTIVTNAGGTVYYPSMLNTAGGGADPQAIGQNFSLFFIQPFGGVWTSTTIQKIAITVTATSAPTIISLSTGSGPVGTPVTITGANFGATQGTSTVTFNGTTATVGTWSASSITTTVPAGATTGNVVVTVGGVNSNGVNFTVSGSGGSAPTIQGICSASTFTVTSLNCVMNGNVLTTSDVLVIYTESSIGSFTGTSVTGCGATWTLDPIVASSTTHVTMATGLNPTVGACTATVNNLGGTTADIGVVGVVVTGTNGIDKRGATTNVGSVSSGSAINAPSLTTTQANDLVLGLFQQVSGVSGTWTVGSGWTSDVIGGFGTFAEHKIALSAGAIQPTATFSSTSIMVAASLALLPSGSGPPPTAPTITNLSVNTGPVGTSVTVTGTNFGTTQGTSTITFNGTAATATSWNATTIVTTVPTGATTGSVIVTVGGQASNGINFTVTTPPPTFAASAYTSLAGLTPNVQPTLTAMQANVVRCAADNGSGWVGGGRTNIIVANNIAMPQLPVFNICTTPTSGAGAQALQYTTVNGTPPGNPSAQYFFPVNAARTAVSAGLHYCMDFDQAVLGGQYSNAQIDINGVIANLVIGGTVNNFLSLEVPAPPGPANNSGAPQYHGGNCTTDPTAWRWQTWQVTNTQGQLSVYDNTGSILLGHSFGPMNGNVTQAGSFIIGISGGEAEVVGGHIYWGNLLFDSINGTFPLLPPLISSNLFNGMVFPSRAATSWPTTGVIGGIPSATWTQSGATIAAGASSATIQAALNACAGTNKFVLLGPGTFNPTASISYPAGCELRGSGPNSTFVVPTSAIHFTTFNATGGTYAGAGAFQQWTSGYAQGTTQIIVSSVAGVTPNVTGVILDQCEDNLSGDTCSTGSYVDNGNYHNCTADPTNTNTCGLTATNGGAAEGADGQYIANRYQAELFLVTAINQNSCGATCITLDHGLDAPNWSAARTPHATYFTPAQFAGLSNFSLDSAAVGPDTNGSPSIGMGLCANCWIHNMRIANSPSAGISRGHFTVHSTIDNSYITGSNVPTGNSRHAIVDLDTGSNLIQNNIIQGFSNSVSTEGFEEGSVVGYNLVIGMDLTNSNTGNSFHAHSGGDTHTLYEGNIGANIQSDDTHGFQPMKTEFRNFMNATDSCANGQCGTATGKSFQDFALSLFDGARYNNYMFNVWGTSGVTTKYLNGGDNTIYSFSTFDPLVASTRASWGNYDTFTGKSLFCASGHTNFASCPNGDETGQNATVFPNPVPTVGDTGAGQAAAPPSFYLSSKPSFFTGSIPWPPIGPDVTSGNVGQCSGTINGTAGGYNAMPATSSAQCAPSTLNVAWGGHVNAIPALNCWLNVMGGPPDGIGPGGPNVLAFDPTACYSGGATFPNISFNPGTVNFTNQPIGQQSLPVTITMQNTGNANLVITAFALQNGASSKFVLGANTCGSPVPPNLTCTVKVSFLPVSNGLVTDNLQITDNAGAGVQVIPLSGFGGSTFAIPETLSFKISDLVQKLIWKAGL